MKCVERNNAVYAPGEYQTNAVCATLRQLHPMNNLIRM